jgi:hypothetical protein
MAIPSALKAPSDPSFASRILVIGIECPCPTAADSREGSNHLCAISVGNTALPMTAASFTQSPGGVSYRNYLHTQPPVGPARPVPQGVADSLTSVSDEFSLNMPIENSTR